MATPIGVPPRPMGLSEVVGLTYGIYRLRFGRLVKISLVHQLATLLLLVPLAAYGMFVIVPEMSLARPVITSGFAMSSLVGSVVEALLGLGAVVVSVYFLGLLVHAVNQAMLGLEPTVAELLALNRGTLRRLGPLYAFATLACYLVLALGFAPMLRLVPELVTGTSSAGPGFQTMPDALFTKLLTAWGVGMLSVLVLMVASGTVAVKLAYINQVGTVEGKGLMAAVKRAAALTKGSFWRTAGYLIVLGLALGIVQQVVVMVAEAGLLPVMAAMDPRHPEATVASSAWMYGVLIVLVLALQAVLEPIMVAFVTVMYADQVRRVDRGPRP